MSPDLLPIIYIPLKSISAEGHSQPEFFFTLNLFCPRLPVTLRKMLGNPSCFCDGCSLLSLLVKGEIK